jgi:membrane-bound lytic murein transglycosylase MltF
LEDEDLLEMLNAGLVQFVVVDQAVAEFWSRILPKIRVRQDLVVNSGGEIAWMFREISRQLKAAVDDFIKRHPSSDPTRAEILRKYLKSTKFVKNATSQEELRKFQATVDLFRKYGPKYDVDYLMMIAQGYQESRLDQGAKSHVGAVGIMQVMPATGQQMKVGDITKIDPDVHAGVKFITFIRDEYFGNEPMDELNKDLFAFAAYNAGPGRISGLRKLAAKRGLDPNVWFDNVEVVVSEKVGRERITYVGNIYKYDIAYRLITEAEAAEGQDHGEVDAADCDRPLAAAHRAPCALAGHLTIAAGCCAARVERIRSMRYSLRWSEFAECSKPSQHRREAPASGVPCCPIQQSQP